MPLNCSTIRTPVESGRGSQRLPQGPLSKFYSRLHIHIHIVVFVVVAVGIFIFIFTQPALGARAAWVRTREVGNCQSTLSPLQSTVVHQMASTAFVSPSSSTLHSKQQPISSPYNVVVAPNASGIQTSCFFGMSLLEAKGGLSISKTYNPNTKITRTGMPLVRARTAGASKTIEVDVDKPLGVTLGQKSGGGVLITGIESGGNAERAGLKVGDQVLYTSSFFGDELWPADKLGFTKTAIQAKPDSVYFVVSRGVEVDVKRLPKRPAPPRFGRKLTEAQKARATHICLDCGYIYTLSKSFDDQRDDFVCPQCSAPKKRFAKYDVAKGKAIGASPNGSRPRDLSHPTLVPDSILRFILKQWNFIVFLDALPFAMVLPSSISVCCINNHDCKREIACHHPSPISVKPKPTYLCKSTSPSLHCRRKVLQSTILSALLLQPVLSPDWAAAEEENSKKNDLIERLLQKSKANKDKYAKERLDDYYKRNYKDYFEFVEGAVNQGKLTEAEKDIMEWLRKNR